MVFIWVAVQETETSKHKNAKSEDSENLQSRNSNKTHVYQTLAHWLADILTPIRKCMPSHFLKDSPELSDTMDQLLVNLPKLFPVDVASLVTNVLCEAIDCIFDTARTQPHLAYSCPIHQESHPFMYWKHADTHIIRLKALHLVALLDWD